MRTKVVRSVEHLKTLCAKDEKEFHLILNGGMFSRKYIQWDEECGTFRVTNCIDDSVEDLDPGQIMNPRMTNIGEGIKLGAFWMVQ